VSVTEPKRVAVEGVVAKHVSRSGGHDELIGRWSVGPEEAGLVDYVFEDFEGQRVRLVVEAVGPNEVDIDGVVDERRHICYIGKAKRQPNGKYMVLADVGGCLCRVEVSITPTVIGKDPEWEKGLGNG